MAYHQMAHYYDLLMEDAPYDKWISFTEQIIHQSGKKIESIVDLGCGTGQITTRLARAGYRMIGADSSADMLSIADQRARAENLTVQWVHQDLRTLTGIENQDMAVSYCDVLNYITEPDELPAVLENAADSLKPGGLFVFDIHSLNHVENHLVNQTFAEVSDAVSCIWFCLEGENQGEMYHDLTFFVENEGQYARFDEWHHQRTFSVNLFKDLLNDAGFDIQLISGDFSLENDKIDELAERIFITAVKRSE
ncbi:MAG TPA: class I SAM-dependent methyltransferase [Lentibacillus sp.]|uniref:class I SAM-dependent DNA methyltransferase n=1 Tax=Lentibacillus sp. TaxID=1925746 RepID=UPI002B4B2AE7|nr:class I SAM-dependent methyltransferase [Lentibacillus sp.]HLR61104.1 class I SAM-dependent methyltransferase [Lentibacillus sp.]